MKKLSCLIVLLAVGGILFYSCNDSADRILTPAPDNSKNLAAFEQGGLINSAQEKIINNYMVHFDGREFVNNATTFTYVVTGTGIEPALSHFTIELPPCAPELGSYNPTHSVSINHNPQTDIYGIEWHLCVEPDDSEGRTYSITFPGDVPAGEVRVAVKAGDMTGVGVMPGPCAGFDISGTVFVDADSNGVKGLDESGIANVTVTLVDNNDDAHTGITDENGAYLFRKAAGTYTVRIDPETEADDFNEELAESFTPTSVTSLVVTVGPDSYHNDFGFQPKTKKIINDLELGTLETNGESVKFWKKQLKGAIGKGKGGVEYDAATLQGFISEIQELFLEDPYQFTPGNELQEALDILANNSNDPLVRLMRELLATEFNEVSGRGIISAGDLQLVLISWGESLVYDNLYPGTLEIRGGAGGVEPSKMDEAARLFGLINGSASTGGGGGGE